MIANAIRTWRLMEFIYDGNHRIVEPYALGTDSQKQFLLQAWEVYGPNPGWGVFHLDRLLLLRETERSFLPLRDFSEIVQHVKTVYIRVCVADTRLFEPFNGML